VSIFFNQLGILSGSVVEYPTILILIGPSCSILTSSHAHRISIEEKPAGHLNRSPEQLGHLPGGRLRSSGMPHEGYADPLRTMNPDST
jgi:hypothetical protein